jgi:prepilin-type N-terminal cleavage/methylation domain-containing protein
MTKFHKNQRGFTVGEILIVITALGVLAVISVPIFTSIVQDANTKAEDYNVACIKTGIELQRYKDYTDSL